MLEIILFHQKNWNRHWNNSFILMAIDRSKIILREPTLTVWFVIKMILMVNLAWFLFVIFSHLIPFKLTDQMYIFFSDDAKIGIKQVKMFCQRMQEDNITRAIIVVQQNMTPSARQAIVDMAPKYIL